MSNSQTSPNQRLVDEVNEAGSWFFAKKTNHIWARRLERNETVTTLEGSTQVSAGDYLCRGVANELWPQSADRLEKAYTASGEFDTDGFQRFDPNPDFDGVLASAIDHEFDVIATWGTLKGKPGDFLVRNFADRNVEYPADLWVVDQSIFAATYQAVTDTDPSEE